MPALRGHLLLCHGPGEEHERLPVFGRAADAAPGAASPRDPAEFDDIERNQHDRDEVDTLKDLLRPAACMLNAASVLVLIADIPFCHMRRGSCLSLVGHAE